MSDQPNSPRMLFTADARFELKRVEGKPTTLAGYAIVYNSLSTDRGGYRVRVLPGAVRFAQSSLALWHHDYRHPIGNMANGTLRITFDNVGARVEIDLPNTMTGRDVAELVEKKYVQGMSWSLSKLHNSRAVTENGIDILELMEAEADEVTVTAIPAFTDTTISVQTPAGPKAYADRMKQSNQLERLTLDMITID